MCVLREQPFYFRPKRHFHNNNNNIIVLDGDDGGGIYIFIV
jgi:hypothetical protein